MTCTITVDGPCRRTLSFSIDRESIDSELEEALQEIARTQRFKGFRAGKVPLDLVRKTHGPALTEEIRRRRMGEAFGQAIQEHGLRPVGDPEMNLQALGDDDGGPLTFELSIEVAPEIQLQLEDRIPVTIVLPDVEPSMVDNEVERIRKQAAELEDAPEGTLIGAKDILEGSLTWVVEGTELEPRDASLLLEHDLLDGVRIEGAGQSFGGKMVGDTVELTATLPAHFDPTEHAGKEATARFTIQRHRLVKLPEFDDELLGKLGVASEAELRSHIQAGLDGQRRQFGQQQIDREIDKQLLAGHDFELPERLVARTIDHRVHEYAHHLMERDQQTAEDAHAAAEGRREEIAQACKESLRLTFLMAQIAQDHGLGATREAAEEQVRAIAAQKGGDPQEAIKSAHAEGWLGDVQEQLTREAARRWLRERADVTETRPEPTEEDAPGQQPPEEQQEEGS